MTQPQLKAAKSARVTRDVHRGVRKALIGFPEFIIQDSVHWDNFVQKLRAVLPLTLKFVEKTGAETYPSRVSGTSYDGGSSTLTVHMTKEFEMSDLRIYHLMSYPELVQNLKTTAISLATRSPGTYILVSWSHTDESSVCARTPLSFPTLFTLTPLSFPTLFALTDYLDETIEEADAHPVACLSWEKHIYFANAGGTLIEILYPVRQETFGV